MFVAIVMTHGDIDSYVSNVRLFELRADAIKFLNGKLCRAIEERMNELTCDASEDYEENNREFFESPYLEIKEPYSEYLSKGFVIKAEYRNDDKAIKVLALRYLEGDCVDQEYTTEVYEVELTPSCYQGT
jgi:hypothetical protein